MDLTISGKVIAVLEKRAGVSSSTGNAWATQSFVIETAGQYPKKCCIEIFGTDKIDKLLPVVGEEITAHIEIDCREYQGRWYNQIRAWKIDKAVEQTQQEQQVRNYQKAQQQSPQYAQQQPEQHRQYAGNPFDEPTTYLPF